MLYTHSTKHAFAKKCLRHDLPLLLNDIPDIVTEKRITHSPQGYTRYGKFFVLLKYHVKLRTNNHLSTLSHFIQHIKSAIHTISASM